MAICLYAYLIFLVILLGQVVPTLESLDPTLIILAHTELFSFSKLVAAEI